jgi:membrane fusion protein, multidrug efflux system
MKAQRNPITSSFAIVAGNVGEMKHLRIWIALVVLTGFGIAVWRLPADHPAATGVNVAPAPIPVVVAIVARGDVPIYLTGIGTVQASNTVTVTARVDGALQTVAFVEGQDVKKGQVLAQIDPRPYKAQLDQTIAKKATDEANLANARVDLLRYQKLVVGNFGSQQQYATQKALVAQLEAQIAGDQASIDYAKTQLEYTTITSPINGRTGIRLIDEGNIVRAVNANGIVVVTQLEPITVIFTLATTSIPEVQNALTRGTLETIAFSQDDKTQLDTGKLLLVDNEADPSSGTVRLKALFPNKQRRLWPGTFTNVRLVTSIQRDGLTVPTDAVQEGPQGQFVFVVGQDQKVAMRPVSVLETFKGEALIDKGLSADEIVVVRGQYRLSPGTLVTLADPNDPNSVPNPSTASSGMLP